MLRITGVVDGNAVHTHKWANYFASSGHEVQLISFVPMSDTSHQYLHPSVKVADWIIPAFHLKRFWITANGIRRLRSILNEFSSNFVHAQLLTYSAWYAALASNVPLVVSVMGGGDILGTSWQPHSLQERYLTPFTLKQTSLAVCWSPNLKRIVEPMVRPGVPCEVVLGGVDLDVFRKRCDVQSLRSSLGLAQDDFVFFSPRIFRPLSNIDILVEAMAIVVKQMPNAHLLLVKYRVDIDPDYEKQIEKRIDELGIRPKIKMIPIIPNNDMPLYYSASDCTASISDTDGTPMTVMESAACGTPAIIQDLLDYDPSIFIDEETVLKVPRKNEEGLARAMIRLATDRNLRERLQRNGEKMVRNNSDYGREMKRLELMYMDMLSRTNGGRQ